MEIYQHDKQKRKVINHASKSFDDVTKLLFKSIFKGLISPSSKVSPNPSNHLILFHKR